MSSIRTLIVDDEPLARERLRRLCEAENGIIVVGECGDGAAAVTRLNDGGVDLLFIDMEMPGASGIEVLGTMSEGTRPAVVFATAHDDFALEAFDRQAVDYLLKPFDRERFQTAVERARRFLGAPRQEHLTFKVDGRLLILEPGEINWVEAADNYVVVHLASGERPMVRETMTAVERRLGTQLFVRVNRSAIVRKSVVKELQPGAHGDYAIVLRDGTMVPLSRSLRGKLETLFGPQSS